MASVAEYFVTDFSLPFRVEAEWRAGSLDGAEQSFKSCMLPDFVANVKYLAFYFQSEISDITLLMYVLDEHARFLTQSGNITLGRSVPTAFQGRVINLGEQGVKLEYQWPGDLKELKDEDLPFTGRVYFYTENDVAPDALAKLYECAGSKGLSLIWRGPRYAAERNALEKPRAFVSHDSRDKEAIARPVATRLRSMLCPVWFDEFALKVGDSLRESIEQGLKTCHMCIFVLTPNFLAKGGWPKREYEIIFTRELVEEKRLILPLWAGVSRDDVYEYSPILADRVAVHWELGEEEVCRRLFNKLVP